MFGGTACPSRSGGFINYVVDTGDLRIIALDSLYPDHPGGILCDTRTAWLRDCLAEGGTIPTVIFMHHPPLKCGVPETDIDGFAGAEEFGDIIEGYPNIERILCGHIHLQTHSCWRGTSVTTAPSMGMQLNLDLTQAAPSKFLLSNPAYLLHHWTPDRVLVTHTVEVGELDGPYDFTHV